MWGGAFWKGRTIWDAVETLYDTLKAKKRKFLSEKFGGLKKVRTFADAIRENFRKSGLPIFGKVLEDSFGISLFALYLCDPVRLLKLANFLTPSVRRLAAGGEAEMFFDLLVVQEEKEMQKVYQFL